MSILSACFKCRTPQVLPFASEETLSRLERNISGLPNVTDMLHEGLSARDITGRLFEGLGVAESSFSLRPAYGPCEAAALKDRMKQAVALLGERDVEQLLEEQGKIEVLPSSRTRQSARCPPPLRLYKEGQDPNLCSMFPNHRL